MDDDTISRKAAIDAVSWGCHEFRGIFADCEKNLNALPSTERHGRWIHKKYRWIKSISMWWSAAYECSICGEAGLKDWSYCPNCGAKME
jgi:hypothetical protein